MAYRHFDPIKTFWRGSDEPHQTCPIEKDTDILPPKEDAGVNVDVKSSQVTGNAAMHYVAWQLSKNGWNVMPTMRNAKGSDLYCANDAETIVFGVQSKGLSKKAPVGLGTNLENLRSDWWIITINAKSDSPTCFIMTRQEVIDLCFHSDPAKSRDGIRSYWLQPKAYDQPQFRDAWHRLSTPPVH